MSRIGKKIIKLPAGVKVTTKPGSVHVEGPKGKLDGIIPAGIDVKVTGQEVQLVLTSQERGGGALHGLARSLLANMVEGVTNTFSKQLEINGVGYRAEVAGDKLTMALGYSHPVIFPLPKAVQAKVDKNRIILTSPDRDILGQTAAKVRELRPPEPYKGKGVKYAEEVIKKKAGKAGATGGGS